jgi:hypothetical protein
MRKATLTRQAHLRAYLIKKVREHKAEEDYKRKETNERVITNSIDEKKGETNG